MTRQMDFHVDISDDMVAEAQTFVGMPLRVESWNQEATLDTVRHYAWGIGDSNPLWSDEDYAAGTPHGAILAPPTFLYSVFDGAIGLGFAGVQPFYAGTTWQFFERIRRGDRFRPKATMGPVTMHEGGQAGTFAMQTVEVDYVRVADEVVVAHAVGKTFRVPRSGASRGLRYEQREPHQYSDDELQDIAEQALAAPRQGKDSRHVEDVTVGDVVPPVVKGPLKQITMTSYYAGCIGSPGYKADELAWLYRTWALNDPDRLPNNYDPTYFSERVLPSLGHQDAGVARELGMPGAYGNGPQKCGWMGHAVTNWMGDDGELTALDIRLRRPDVFGDVSWCSGTVRAVDRTSGLVDLDLRAVNQRGELTCEGTATVRLRARGA